jgi:hypothetical protein
LGELNFEVRVKSTASGTSGQSDASDAMTGGFWMLIGMVKPQAHRC